MIRIEVRHKERQRRIHKSHKSKIKRMKERKQKKKGKSREREKHRIRSLRAELDCYAKYNLRQFMIFIISFLWHR